MLDGASDTLVLERASKFEPASDMHREFNED